MNSLRKILNSTKRFLGTSLLVGALTVNSFLTENVQSQDLESKVATVSAETSPEVEWDKTFGGSNWDLARSVQQTKDGGYIVAGTTSGSFGQDFWLIKTDADGNEEWDKTFGGSESDYAYSVQQTSDGGYILAGYTEFLRGEWHTSPYLDLRLIKTDSNGNKEWNKTFDNSGEDCAYSVQQTSDKGYIIAGVTKSFGVDDYYGNCDFWLIKTDADGNKEWDKTFGGSNDDYAFSVQQTTDGGYILAGQTRPFTTNDWAEPWNSWLIKTDADGNKEWDKTFGGSDDDWARSVQQTKDGGYIITGLSTKNTKTFIYHDSWLIKTDADGNKEWDKTFEGYYSYDGAHSVQQTSDGGYIIAGTALSFPTCDEYDIQLIKTDSTGNMEWDKTFGGSGNDYAFSVQQTTDRGYIVAGGTKSFGAGDWDFWLIKLKGNGETSVEENQLPTAYSLLQNYPNPFNLSTTIQYQVPENTKVSLDIYNISGQKIKTLVDKIQKPGSHQVKFDANDLSSGIYLYQLRTQYGVKTQKMMLVK